MTLKEMFCSVLSKRVLGSHCLLNLGSVHRVKSETGNKVVMFSRRDGVRLSTKDVLDVVYSPRSSRCILLDKGKVS